MSLSFAAGRIAAIRREMQKIMAARGAKITCIALRVFNWDTTPLGKHPTTIAPNQKLLTLIGVEHKKFIPDTAAHLLDSPPVVITAVGVALHPWPADLDPRFRSPLPLLTCDAPEAPKEPIVEHSPLIGTPTRRPALRVVASRSEVQALPPYVPPTPVALEGDAALLEAVEKMQAESRAKRTLPQGAVPPPRVPKAQNVARGMAMPPSKMDAEAFEKFISGE